MIMNKLEILIVSFLINLLLLFCIYPFLKKNILAIPNKRSSHYKKIPTAGGISFVTVGTIYSYFLGLWQPLLIIPLAITGIIDDCIIVNTKTKYFVQLVTAGLLIKSTINYKILDGNFNPLIIIGTIFILIALTAFINLVNFMDGLDGLVAGCMSIIILCISFTSTLQLVPIAGSLIAFLIFNWQPAKIFMGDVGSTFLGGILGLIILSSSNLIELASRLILITPLLADASLCIVRRYFAGEKIFRPHKLHLFQRLHQAGYKHYQISSIYIISTLILSIFYYFGYLKLLFLFCIFILIFGLFLDRYIAVPFKKSLISE